MLSDKHNDKVIEEVDKLNSKIIDLINKDKGPEYIELNGIYNDDNNASKSLLNKANDELLSKDETNPPIPVERIIKDKSNTVLNKSGNI